MNGSGALTGSTAVGAAPLPAPPRPRRRRPPDAVASVGAASVGAASVGAASGATSPTSSTGAGAAFLRLRGGGALGAGIGPSSTPLDVGPVRLDFLTAEPAPARSLLRLAARVAMRLFGPRTGVRATKTQPTPGNGLPPIRRPSSNSHSYSPWHSWYESLE